MRQRSQNDNETMKEIKIAVINYPTASQSALYGIVEMLELANTMCEQINADVAFSASIYKEEQLNSNALVDVVILPPSMSETFFEHDFTSLINYMEVMQSQGVLLASACVGAFILGKGGFLDNKVCTTHWRIADHFMATFPTAKLDAKAIVVNGEGVITAGGRMAWIDLVFEIISTLSSPTIALNLSKEMVVDTGYREQGFYHQFSPKKDHGDALVVKAQNYLANHYSQPISLSDLASHTFVSQRTLQRRFTQALGMSVIDYLQKLRLHHACQQIEVSTRSIADIAFNVGYQNVNAFRKIFRKEYGLSPVEYRKRFAIN